MSTPAKDSPPADRTGERCQAGDMGDVFFLAGSFVGPVVRKCTISEGQEILFPIITSSCIDKPGGLREPHNFPDPGVFDPPKGRPGSCIEDAESTIDTVSTLEVTIDGVSIEHLKENFRVQSNPFPVKLPKDNLFGVPPGTYTGISDGYWVLVEPLPVGEHTIHFAAQAVFEQDITYHLTVE